MSAVRSIQSNREWRASRSSFAIPRTMALPAAILGSRVVNPAHSPRLNASEVC